MLTRFRPHNSNNNNGLLVRNARPTASSSANPLNLSTGSLFQGACFLLVISGERLSIVGINKGLTSLPPFLYGGKNEGEKGGMQKKRKEKKSEKKHSRGSAGAALWRNTKAGEDVRTNYWISLVA